jgi:hypothetical protein
MTGLTQDVMAVWPQEQALARLDEPTIAVTQFADASRFHPGLIAKILELEKGSAFRGERFPGGCGVKIRDIARWGHEGANLVHARAMELFKRVTGQKTAVVDDCWASIYSTGDDCMPHSHLRAMASVVYLLDPGDESDDPTSGKLCFADPRLACCCQVEEGRMTNLLVPEMHAGSMIIFPAGVVHCVGIYRGKRPRITMSWNITPEALPGKPRRLEAK